MQKTTERSIWGLPMQSYVRRRLEGTLFRCVWTGLFAWLCWSIWKIAIALGPHAKHFVNGQWK